MFMWIVYETGEIVRIMPQNSKKMPDSLAVIKRKLRDESLLELGSAPQPVQCAYLLE